jgi:pSer/pThr/pTyr-binding forkhead associated (FHA) protein
VIREGQPVMRANRILLDHDIWYISKVVSRIHAEIWAKDGQVYIRDIGSSSGTFLNKMRLSPSGKESRPYPIREGDILQFGVDYRGKQEDIYKAIVVKVAFHDQNWLKKAKMTTNNIK